MQDKEEKENPVVRFPQLRSLLPHDRQFPIAYKLAMILTVMITLGMVSLGLLITKNQGHLLEQQIHTYANSMTRQLADSVTEPILANDNLALSVAISSTAKLDGVLGAAIYSDENRPLVESGLIPDAVVTPKHDSTTSIVWGREQGGQRAMASFFSPIRFREITLGYAMLTFDRDVLNQARKQSVTTIMSATLFMVFIGLLIAIYLGKRLTRPIHQLINGSRQISAGDYHFRFSERRNDELGLLIDSLNTMTDGLLHKEQVEKTFQRYVPRQVASELLNNLDQVRLGGKHVDASVLFADIVGFTRLSEDMPPHELNSLLNEYFTLIDRASHSFQGHIDKYMGDCAMLLFGVPAEDPEHCLHAISCAVLIQRLIADFNKQRLKQEEITVEFRIGVNSGTMLAGNMGSENRMEYTVVGDSVNLASRLSSVAGAGEIVVSEAVHNNAALANHFITRKHSTMRLRGKTKAVAIYQVLDVRDQLDNKKLAEIQTRLLLK